MKRLAENRNEIPPAHRERILGAATDCFLELGFQRTSTAEIARRARVSKRELYTCFKDKRDLLSAMIFKAQDEMQTNLRTLWSSREAPEKVLPKAARILQDFILSEQFAKLLRIIAAESYQNPEIAKQFYDLGPNRGRKTTAKYLSYQMRQGRLKQGDPIRAADDFLDLVVGAQLMTAMMLGQIKGEPQRRNRVKHAVEMFLKNYRVEN
jgi:TetR/AcrR family transcriptional regulator, mexJK operon transcriptional repressor